MVDCERWELACLHLDAWSDAVDRSPAPWAVTAAGIGDALELGTTAAGRVALLDELSSLVDRGLVVTDQRPVSGYERPRTVYRLTDAGREEAAAVRERVTSQSVEVTNGTTEEVPLAEIGRYFGEARAPLVRALARVTEDDQVPLDRHVTDEFVDRTAELDAVETAIEDSFTRESQTVVVRGPTGMGKTAVIEQAVDRVRDRHDDLRVASGRVPEGRSDAYAPLVRAFESVPGGDAVLSHLRAARSSFSPADSDTLQAQRTGLFNDVADALRTLATEQPVVLVVDNLQWADEATLSLFTHLATEIDELVYPVAFLATTRPASLADGETVLSQAVETVDRDGTLVEVPLEPLERADVRALLADRLGRQRLPDGFVDLVVDRTGGNPLFVRETATHLLETDAVDPATERYPTSADAVSLPGAVTDQIEKRLARLDAPSREVLRLGAVIGERIPGRVLAAASDLAPATRREYVDLLVASRIWERAEGARPAARRATTSDQDAGEAAETGALEFVSGGVREAVVDRMPETLAAQYHDRVAGALEAETSGDERAARIAHHHERAGNDDRAVEWYRRAGDRARDSYAHEDAIDSYQRALGLGRETGVVDASELAALTRATADSQRALGAYDHALETISEGLALAPDAASERCRLLGLRARIQRRQGAFDESLASAQRQRDVASPIDDVEQIGESHYNVAAAALRQGNTEAAREEYENAFDAFQRVDDQPGIGRALKGLGNVANSQGERDLARERYERARDAFEAASDHHGIATIEHNLHLTAKATGDREQARDHLEAALEEYRRIDDRNGVAKALRALGDFVGEDGDLDAARDYVEEAIAEFEAIGARQDLAIAHRIYAYNLETAGEYDRAREHYERAHAIFSSVGTSMDVALIEFFLGRVAKRQGRYEQAQTYHERALERRKETGTDLTVARSHSHLGLIAQKRGDYERARERYERALARLESASAPLDVAYVTLHRAGLCREEGRYERAEELFEQARDGLEEHAMHVDRALARVDLARAKLAAERGDLETAAQLATDAREAFEDRGFAHLAARCRLVRGRVAAQRSTHQTARGHLERARETFEAVDAPQDVLAALRHLVAVSQETGERNRARELLAAAEETRSEAPEPVAAQHRDWIERARTGLDDSGAGGARADPGDSE